MFQVCLAAFQNGMLEVAVNNDHTDSFHHQVVGEGDTEGGFPDSSLLVGKGDYDWGLYHGCFSVY